MKKSGLYFRFDVFLFVLFISICSAIPAHVVFAESSAQVSEAPVPLLEKDGNPVTWWFVFKFNTHSFPGCGGDAQRECLFGGDVQPAYYLATCNASAETLGRAIRGHWGIENRLHHVLDTSLNEDASRIRQNPGVFAQLRHFGLNLLRHNGQTNIRAALYDNALSLDRVLAYKGIKH